MKLSPIFIVSIIILWLTPCANNLLQKQVATFVSNRQAHIGVDISYDGKTICCVNADKRFSMMSVYKLYQALAVLDSTGNDTTKERIFVGKGMSHENTYSPLREKYPEGNVNLTLAGFLQYSLWLSDNNVCDILFEKWGVKIREQSFKNT